MHRVRAAVDMQLPSPSHATATTAGCCRLAQPRRARRPWRPWRRPRQRRRGRGICSVQARQVCGRGPLPTHVARRDGHAPGARWRCRPTARAAAVIDPSATQLPRWAGALRPNGAAGFFSGASLLALHVGEHRAGLRGLGGRALLSWEGCYCIRGVTELHAVESGPGSAVLCDYTAPGGCSGRRTGYVVCC
jgi:hypothetical protein